MSNPYDSSAEFSMTLKSNDSLGGTIKANQNIFGIEKNNPVIDSNDRYSEYDDLEDDDREPIEEDK